MHEMKEWSEILHGAERERHEHLKASEARQKAGRLNNVQRDGSGAWLIRANQGHSVRGIHSDELLRKITDAMEVPVCVHGINLKAWASIKNSKFE